MEALIDKINLICMLKTWHGAYIDTHNHRHINVAYTHSYTNTDIQLHKDNHTRKSTFN